MRAEDEEPKIQANLVMDSASTLSFITTGMADKLGLKRRPSGTEAVSGFMGATNDIAMDTTDIYICSYDNTVCILLSDVYIVPVITTDLPPIPARLASDLHTTFGVQLEHKKKLPVHLLIGTPHLHHLVLRADPVKVARKHGKQWQCMLWCTKLGFAISGDSSTNISSLIATVPVPNNSSCKPSVETDSTSACTDKHEVTIMLKQPEWTAQHALTLQNVSDSSTSVPPINDLTQLSDFLYSLIEAPRDTAEVDENGNDISLYQIMKDASDRLFAMLLQRASFLDISTDTFTMPLSPAEQACEDHFRATTVQDPVTGRYTIRLAFRSAKRPTNNYDTALRVLKSVENGLKRFPWEEQVGLRGHGKILHRRPRSVFARRGSKRRRFLSVLLARRFSP